MNKLILLLLAGAFCGLLDASAASTYEPYRFSTFAGVTGTAGSIDGPRVFARFSGPYGAAVDGAGNIYVADNDKHTIRKITPGGVVTTLAGLAGSSGSADGPGPVARFNAPHGVAVDSSGNVYVADFFNDTIRKITPSGVVSTLAGAAGMDGSTDGMGAAARFKNPSGIAVDSSGNLYVTDAINCTIRAITPAGLVTTLAGLAGSVGSADGTGSAAQFNTPLAIAIDASSNNLYVADTNNETIRKITPSGVVTTFAGLAGAIGSVDGTGSAARFYDPFGIAVDSSGYVYVGDTFNETIRKITPGGTVTTIAGTMTVHGNADGTGTGAQFYHPLGVAVDSAGNIFVADSDNYTIRKIAAGNLVSTVAGTVGVAGSTDGASTGARFYGLRDVALDSAGNIYIADFFNDTIRKITPAGSVTTLAGLAGSPGSSDGTGSAARFDGPAGLTVDGAGNIYVADSFNCTIRKITPAGVVTTFAGDGNIGSADGTGSAARFDFPASVALDSSGNLYVADRVNCTIRKITPAGVVTTLAGLAQNVGSTDGTGSAARFNGPWAVSVDGTGNIYVADTGNQTIRKVTSAGVVTTLAGLAGNPGSADGTGSAARFDNPLGVAATSGGNVYVSDTNNSTIRAITSGGVVTTLVGLAGNPGSTDGTGSAARFDFPLGMTVGGDGNVYLADDDNSIVRKITPAGVVTTPAGSPGNGGSGDGWVNAAEFFQAYGVAVDNAGNTYVADTFNHTIRKISANGLVSTLAGSPGVSGSADGTGNAARFNTPTSVAADSAGNVFVADVGNDTIRKITSAGVVTTFAGAAGLAGSSDGTGNAARFNLPFGVAVDHSGNICVADYGNNTIRKITPAAGVSTLAGLAGNSGSTDGTGSAARFFAPEGVAADSAGNVFVADAANHTIRKVTSAGVVTTLAGLAGVNASDDGTGSAAHFWGPSSVSVDNAGNIYVADTGNNLIRKVTSGGVVTTLGGLAGSPGNSDGIGSIARFADPHGVAADLAGNLYVADQDYSIIRQGVPAVQLALAVSHKVHGSFSGDITLPQTGAPGIECRSGGASKNHQIIMTFASAVTLSSASAIPDPLAPAATGSVSSVSVSGNQVTVNLTNVSNIQRLVLTLSGLSDGTNTNNVGLAMGVLLGDTTGDGTVNSSDVSSTKSKSGQTISGSNFRNDVTVDGTLNSSDVSSVKSKSGTALP